jgi:hypothetical protein
VPSTSSTAAHDTPLPDAGVDSAPIGTGEYPHTAAERLATPVDTKHADDDEPSGDDVQQDTAPQAAAPFQQLRYLEEYSNLAAPDARVELSDAIKYVPLWAGAYLSFGGQHRLRYEYTAPTEIGSAPSQATESVLFSRNLLHADFHPSRHVRLFAQLGAYYALAPADDKPPGVNWLDAAQLFLEVHGDAGPLRIAARVGRQEMGLGSTRWVSIRDGTNMRQAFDLARISLEGKGVTSHTFLGFVPKAQRGVFDDAPDKKNLFWGSFWTLAVVPEDALSLDLFYIGRSRTAHYQEAAGREVRHTLGVRAFGKFPSGFEYIVHGLVQAGKLGETNVRAWGTAGGLWQRLPGVARFIRIGVRGDALSGDSAAGDGKVTTFDPLFPNQTFFSALAAFFPTNLYEVHPIVQFNHDKVRFVVFWRQAVEDSVYAPPGVTLIAPTASTARFTGSQSTLSIGYRATRNLTFDAEYSHIFGGTAFTQAGGRDVDFFGTWTTFTY